MHQKGAQLSDSIRDNRIYLSVYFGPGSVPWEREVATEVWPVPVQQLPLLETSKNLYYANVHRRSTRGCLLLRQHSRPLTTLRRQHNELADIKTFKKKNLKSPYRTEKSCLGGGYKAQHPHCYPEKLRPRDSLASELYTLGFHWFTLYDDTRVWIDQAGFKLDTGQKKALNSCSP